MKNVLDDDQPLTIPSRAFMRQLKGVQALRFVGCENGKETPRRVKVTSPLRARIVGAVNSIRANKGYIPFHGSTLVSASGHEG
ncbi:hypothetical protein TNCT_462781 [Trichonephila clavata]|uniref:Uncharacterized protein n=1 Tax=Trichonephila clavata TaxID=2740835 RepID=A0A8X6IG64_TRICU|nr:hypothetical protein TNCT_462781 [Trichonephila clavata]